MTMIGKCIGVHEGHEPWGGVRVHHRGGADTPWVYWSCMRGINTHIEQPNRVRQPPLCEPEKDRQAIVAWLKTVDKPNRHDIPAAQLADMIARGDYLSIFGTCSLDDATKGIAAHVSTEEIERR